MASQNRFLKYMASAKGRRFTFYASVTTSLGAFAVNYFPHAFFTSKHREFVASYKEGAERTVPGTLIKRFELAQDHLKVIDFDKKFMKPFMVAGFDLYNIGSTKFKYGSLIGIPVNYSYTSTKDIDKSDIIVRGQPVDWNSKGGKLLEESLVLSDDEQIFGIAREIIQLMNNNVLYNSLIASGAIVTYYSLSSSINSKLMLFYKPLSLRFMMYNLVGLFVVGLYSFATDILQVNCDKNTDAKLASMGRGFLEAGARFYDKLLKKNIACRELTDDDSEYTAMGNEAFLLRQKRLPLTMRKAFFELKLKDLEEMGKKAEEGAAN